MFEPFFTTKEVGEGTGLGLSIALGIATAHGGVLELRDSDKGACFQLTLPAHAMVMPAERGLTPAAAPDPAPGGRRHALVIEDEEPIRTLLARLLCRRDYEVSEAATCAQARTLSEGRTFDLVLCDVRLGDGNGGDCLRHIRAAQPGLGRRFIFVTGDIAALEDATQEFGDMPVLTKPFTATDLDRVLGDVEVGV